MHTCQYNGVYIHRKVAISTAIHKAELWFQLWHCLQTLKCLVMPIWCCFLEQETLLTLLQSTQLYTWELVAWGRNPLNYGYLVFAGKANALVLLRSTQGSIEWCTCIVLVYWACSYTCALHGCCRLCFVRDMCR